jgi:Carboxypeptidase regulatory-like domain
MAPVKAWREGKSRWALAALLGCFALFAGAPIADAAGTGTITGTVTHASTPVEKVEVEVFSATTEAFVSSATTSATGAYTVTVAPGSYKVGFFPASGSKLVSQYYDKEFSLPTADVVPVVEGAETKNIGAELGEGGKISGTVTDVHGNPLPDIEVTASSEASGVVSATTEAAGKYTLAGLAQGSYTVSFYPAFELNFVPQYYNAAASFLEATPVLVKEEKTTEITTELQVGGEISGRVTDAATHKPLADYGVYAENARGFDFFGGFADTNANGEYTIVGLGSGAYNLEFFPESEGGTEYIAQTDNGVGVTQGSTTSGINVALVPKAPNNTNAPVASGTPAVGQMLSCSTGSWTGEPKPAYTYTWLSNGNAIAGETGSTYVVQPAEQSYGISCKVTATNKHGKASATSNTLNVPPPPPPPPPAIVVSTSKLVASHGVAPVLVGCTVAAPCKGSIEVTEQIVVKSRRPGKHGRRKTVSRKVTVVLATGSFSLAPGQSATIDLSLTVQGRRALAKARRHRLSGKLLASVTGGPSVLKPVVLSEVVKPKRKAKHR